MASHKWWHLSKVLWQRRSWQGKKRENEFEAEARAHVMVKIRWDKNTHQRWVILYGGGGRSCGPGKKVLFALCRPHVPVNVSLPHVLAVCLHRGCQTWASLRITCRAYENTGWARALGFRILWVCGRAHKSALLTSSRVKLILLQGRRHFGNGPLVQHKGL